MITLPEPIIVACQFGALGIVYGLMWLAQRHGRRIAHEARLLWHIGIIRWLGVQLAIWRGRRVQDRDQAHRPRHSRWAWHWSRTWWEAGFRYAPRGEGWNAIWTKRIGLFIDWRKVRRWLGMPERRRQRFKGPPPPFHPNCRCVLVPASGLPPSLWRKPRANDVETAWGRTSFACARSATPAQCGRCLFAAACDYRRKPERVKGDIIVLKGANGETILIAERTV
jgi:hypothetical protein